MGLQVLVDHRREFEHRPFDRATGDARLIGNPGLQQGITSGDCTAGFTSRRIFDTALLARFDHLQQLAQRIEAARKTGVSVKLHQYFLGLVDGKARVQTLVQGLIQTRHIAGCHKRRDQHDGLLLARQAVGRRWGIRGSGRRAFFIGVGTSDAAQTKAHRQYRRQRVGSAIPDRNWIERTHCAPSAYSSSVTCSAQVTVLPSSASAKAM